MFSIPAFYFLAGEACGTKEMPISVKLVAPPLFILMCSAFEISKGCSKSFIYLFTFIIIMKHKLLFFIYWINIASKF
jgi:hypothetical protein